MDAMEAIDWVIFEIDHPHLAARGRVLDSSEEDPPVPEFQISSSLERSVACREAENERAQGGPPGAPLVPQ